MDGIIFDVDGTLWDSTEAVAKSWNQAIEENTDFSLSLTADGLKSLFGKTMDEITLALFPSCPKEERDRIGYLCFDYENRMLETDHGILYPDVARTLESLSRKSGRSHFFDIRRKERYENYFYPPRRTKL